MQQGEVGCEQDQQQVRGLQQVPCPHVPPFAAEINLPDKSIKPISDFMIYSHNHTQFFFFK